MNIPKINYYKEILKMLPIKESTKQKMEDVAIIRSGLAGYIAKRKKLCEEDIDTLLMWFAAYVRDTYTDSDTSVAREKLSEYLALYKDRR